MAARRQAHDEEAWRNAKKICQLSAQQVEMARALGMNPKKLPRLRPSPRQRWKLPVGEFIEECYRKQFGGDPLDHHQHRPGPESRKLPISQRHVDARKRVTDAASQLRDPGSNSALSSIPKAEVGNQFGQRANNSKTVKYT